MISMEVATNSPKSPTMATFAIRRSVASVPRTALDATAVLNTLLTTGKSSTAVVQPGTSLVAVIATD
jgi:hypothetical protein